MARRRRVRVMAEQDGAMIEVGHFAYGGPLTARDISAAILVRWPSLAWRVGHIVYAVEVRRLPAGAVEYGLDSVLIRP